MCRLSQAAIHMNYLDINNKKSYNYDIINSCHPECIKKKNRN